MTTKFEELPDSIIVLNFFQKSIDFLKIFKSIFENPSGVVSQR